MNLPQRARILCLHGRCQNGSIFYDKISGARRKLNKMYDLVFLDAPLQIKDDSLAWWNRREDTHDGPKTVNTNPSSSPQQQQQQQQHPDSYSSYHISILHALEYVQNHPLVQDGKTFDVLLGFSQGGTLATALAISGILKGVKAVVTAGAPYIPEALEVAQNMALILQKQQQQESIMERSGYTIPKLHLAGKMDTLVPVDSTRLLCDKGGYGQMILHEQGHLFPTRSMPVTDIMNFLQYNI